MANKKTRALRRAEYLRQREAMDMQAREAVAMQTVEHPRACRADAPEKQMGMVQSRSEVKHSGTSCGEVCQ